jgi:alpha-amylase
MKYIFTIAASALLLWSCSNDADVSQNQSIQTGNGSVQTKAAGSKVMMQAFYWDVPAGGTWWNTVKGKVPSWSSAGFDAIWLPPATKAQNGGFSMGYDPFDYYDFGSYNQMGSTETRFGSLAEIQSLIYTAQNNNLRVYADIVVNQKSGGS